MTTASTINHSATEFAIKKTLFSKNFDKHVFFSDVDLGYNLYKTLPNFHYEAVSLDKNFGLLDYAKWCVKDLNKYVKTDHVLIIQYDGFATNPASWEDSFLEYDYIGSPTLNNYGPLRTAIEQMVNSKSTYPDERVSQIFNNSFLSKNFWWVGGGGFSLRSKKLLEALQDEEIQYNIAYDTPDEDGNCATRRHTACEDISICIVYKELLQEKYGIKFAPMEVANRFASEMLINSNSFGFHGFQNSPHFLTEEECMIFFSNFEKTGFLDDHESTWSLLGNSLIKFYPYFFGYLLNRCKSATSLKKIIRRTDLLTYRNTDD